jgi:energy-coupling factor transporter ATP-binding protein EcfA2
MAVPDDQASSRRLHQAIRQTLVSMGGRRTRGKDGRERILHSCLFHDDPDPSASFYADDGWYYCHGCGQQYDVDEVVAELRERGLLSIELAGKEDRAAHGKEEARRERGGLVVPGERQSRHHHSRFGEPDVVYTYRHPNGRVSHYRLRWNRYDDEGQYTGKDLRTQAANYAWSDVVITWPVYGDTTLWPGLNIVVCEGEKAVDAIQARGELYNGSLIVAVTCGGSENLLSHSRTLADRLAELAPARVLLWPDNDHRRQTMRWVAPLQRALEAHGVTVGRVDLPPLGLPAKAGPDDYVDLGGQLADIFGTTFTPAGAPTLDQLIRDTVMTRDGRVLIPSTRRLALPSAENLEAIWYRHTGGQVPKQAALKLLRAGLLSRGFDSRVQVTHRRWHDVENTCLYWRPFADGACYRIDKDGVTATSDPPDTLLMVEDEARFDPTVDEFGTMDDLERLAGFFGLGPDRTVLLLGWLVCALVGLETPILVLRGESGAGKTTLAQLLMAVLEPGVPHVSLPSDQRANFDSRQFVETLRRATGVVIDNVTRFSAEAEDLLSQVVTGYGVSQRRLNTHDIEMMNMRRALIITTIHWDVKKGDLATRLLPIHLEDRSEYIPRLEVRPRFDPLVRRIRGFVFAAAQEFYVMRDVTPKRTHIRIADLGFVLAALGYDGPEVAGQVHRMRASALSETDYWLDAVVSMYHERYEDGYPSVGDYFQVSGLDVVTHMVNHGCEDVPSHRSPALARWLRERNPMFKEYGFVVEYMRNVAFRGYQFRTIRREEWGDEG